MKKILTVTVLLLAVCTVSRAQQVIRSENINTYNALEFTGKVTVEMTKAQNNNSTIEITLVETDAGRLDWGVRADGTLYVRLRPNASNSRAAAEVKLSYNAFKSLKASGAGVVFGDVVEAGILDIEVSSGGTFSGEVDVQDVSFRVTGNSAADVKGKAKYYTLVANGRSKVDSRGLEVQDANISAASMAEVYVRAQERLQISSDTGASVFYGGEPAILRTSAKTLGEINFIGK